MITLNKVLILGAGLTEIQYELAALILLSIIYFGIGIWLFQHNQLAK